MSMAASRRLSREVDKIRKRYKRDVVKYSRIAETSKGHRKALAESMVARAEKAIAELRYDRKSGGYSSFVMNKIGTLEFESKQENRVAAQRLRAMGQDSAFYVATKDLWYMKNNGLSVNENIVSSLREKGYDVGDLGEAIDVISSISGTDFNSPDASNEWERYSEESVLVTSMILRSALG